MTVLEQSEVQTQGYYSFLIDAIGSKDFQVFRMAGDASTRRYYRVVQNEDSWVLMEWDPFVPEEFSFLSVHELFRNHGIEVPKIFNMDPSKGLVLMEDLGDLTLERKFWEFQNQELVLPFYRMAIDQMGAVHHKATNERNKTYIPFKIEFNKEKFMWELNHTMEHLVKKFLKIKLSPNIESEIYNCLERLSNELADQPKVVCHRDYHSRNLMIKLGKMYVIDFQDARLGPVQYDLVSLVKDSYVNLNAPMQGAIIDYYITVSKEYGFNVNSREEFTNIFEKQLVQRCFKACGNFASFYNTREDRRYLKYLAPTLHRVAAAAELHSELHPLRKFIIDFGLLENEYNP